MAIITWKLALYEGTAEELTLFLYDGAGNIVSGPIGGPVAGVGMTESGFGGNFTCDTTVDGNDMQAVVKVAGNAVAEDTLFSGSNIVGIVGANTTIDELLRLTASAAVGTVASVDNGNGTFNLTFYDTDGTTAVATATYTAADGDRVRTS